MKKNPPLFLNIFKILFTLGIALCAFAACSNLGGFDERPDSTLAEGALLQRGEGEGILNGSIFSESDCARTAMPTVASTGYSYEVVATNGAKIVTVPNSEIAADGKFAILLSYGTWRVTANANDSDKTIFTQTKTVTLSESAPIVDLNFILSYSQDVALGPGKIDLTINYDTAAGIANIDYSFYKGSSSVYKFFEASGGSFNISHTVTTLGAYSLVINFYDSAGAVLYRIDQVVNTYANLTTDKFEGNAEYISAGNINVTKDIIDKFRLSAFYVGGTGIGGKPASDTNSGSQFAPLKTLTRAVQMVNTSPLTPAGGFKIFVQGNTNEIFTPGGFGNIELDSGKTLAIKGTERGNTVGIGGNFVANGDLSIDNLTFSGAEITAKAGTILEISNTTLRSHKGGWGAGAVKIESGVVATLKGCLIEENEVLFDPSNPSDGGIGGAILCYGELEVTDCIIQKNNSKSHGGAIYIDSSDEVTLTNCQISGNKAGGDGGAIYIKTGAVTLNDCTINGNTATGKGGGIYNESLLSLDGVTFSSNVAAQGKAIWTDGDIDIKGAMKIGDDVYLAVNSADTGGNVSKITITDTLTGTGTVATITVPDDKYSVGRQVLVASGKDPYGVSFTAAQNAALLAANFEKFAVTDQVSGGTTKKWAIDVEGKLDLNSKLETVYLKGTGGNDANSGETEATAVATLSKAFFRLDTDAPNPKIIVASAYALASGEEALLNRAGKSKITIERGTAEGSVMTISSGTVTIANITFDGKKTVYTSSSGRLLNISGGTVTLGEGAVLQNNANNPSGGNGGAVYNSGTLIINGAAAKIIGNEAGYGAAISNYGKVEMNAGTIGGTTSADANKAALNGGGIYSPSSSQGVTITGGSIIGNQAGWGGGICTDKALTISGGTISGNTATNKGNGIYYGNGTLEMSSAAQIADNNDVYLATGKFITIPGSLTPPNTAKPVAVITPPVYTAGTQVLKADGTNVTALTDAICKKFVLLDKDNPTKVSKEFAIRPDSTDNTKGILARPNASGNIAIAGDYKYKFTLYNGSTQIESGGSLDSAQPLKFTVESSYKGGTFAACTADSYTIEIRQGGTPIPGASATSANANVSVEIPAFLETIGVTCQVYMAVEIDGETYDVTLGNLGFPINIATAAAWDSFAAKLNADPSKKVSAKLTADIDISGKDVLCTTTPFNGTIDGNGHTITISSANKFADNSGNLNDFAVCIFGKIGSDGVIKNLTVSSSDIAVGSGASFGGICKDNDGTIENCTNNINFSSSASTREVGGICINNNGTIKNCTNNGNLALTTSTGWGNCPNVGGIAATNTGTIENCTNNGTLVCNQNLGPIVGRMDLGTVTGCTDTKGVAIKGSGR